MAVTLADRSGAGYHDGSSTPSHAERLTGRPLAPMWTMRLLSDLAGHPSSKSSVRGQAGGKARSGGLGTNDGSQLVGFFDRF